MSQLILSQLSTAPSAPSTGKVSVYVDSNGDLSLKDAAGNITTIAVAGSYTLTISSSGTLNLGGNTLAVSGGNPTITGGGTLALAGFTLTVPATGTAALLAVANVFTAAQTMTNLKPTSLAMSAGTTQLVGATSFGMLLVENSSSGAQALIWLAGGANTVASINIRGAITTTKDTASNINVYYSASGSVGYTIQNSYATSQNVNYILVGT